MRSPGHPDPFGSGDSGPVDGVSRRGPPFDLTTTDSSCPHATHSKSTLSWPGSSGSISTSHILAWHFGQARCSSGLSRRGINSERFTTYTPLEHAPPSYVGWMSQRIRIAERQNNKVNRKEELSTGKWMLSTGVTKKQSRPRSRDTLNSGAKRPRNHDGNRLFDDPRPDNCDDDSAPEGVALQQHGMR